MSPGYSGMSLQFQHLGDRTRKIRSSRSTSATRIQDQLGLHETVLEERKERGKYGSNSTVAVHWKEERHYLLRAEVGSA